MDTLKSKISIWILVSFALIASFLAGEYVGQLQAMNAVYKNELTKLQEQMKFKVGVINTLEEGRKVK
jgi:hypothetical protein